MNKRVKLQRILYKLSQRDANPNFEKDLLKVAHKVREKVEIKLAKDSQKKLKDFQDLNSERIDLLKQQFLDNDRKVLESLNTKLNSLSLNTAERIKQMSLDVVDLTKAIRLVDDSAPEYSRLEAQLKDLELEMGKLILSNREDTDEILTTELEKLAKKLDSLEQDTKRLRSSLANHGGNANRNIMIGGNSSTLSRYTDVNITAGSNVTISYTNNDVLKTTDVTFAATSGSSVNPQVPSGTIDGSNVTFTITGTIQMLFLNGAFQTPGGTDYTLSGTTITYVNAPPTGSTHYAL